MAIKKVSKTKPRQPVTLKSARPALMQGWGRVKELYNLKQKLRKDYKVTRTVDKIIVDELAYYIWEINSLMNVKWEVMRRDYAKAIAKMYTQQYEYSQDEAKLEDDIKNEITFNLTKRDASIGRKIAAFHETTGLSEEFVMMTEMRSSRATLDLIDKLL